MHLVLDHFTAIFRPLDYNDAVNVGVASPPVCRRMRKIGRCHQCRTVEKFAAAPAAGIVGGARRTPLYFKTISVNG
jgi:hypothetical protein